MKALRWGGYAECSDDLLASHDDITHCINTSKQSLRPGDFVISIRNGNFDGLIFEFHLLNLIQTAEIW